MKFTFFRIFLLLKNFSLFWTQNVSKLRKSKKLISHRRISSHRGRIEELVHWLRSPPSSTLEGEHGHRIEQRLAEYERRLAEELQRIESHV